MVGYRYDIKMGNPPEASSAMIHWSWCILDSSNQYTPEASGVSLPNIGKLVTTDKREGEAIAI